MTPSTLVFILFIASIYIIIDVQASSSASFDLQETNQKNAEKSSKNEIKRDTLRKRKSKKKKPLPHDFQEEPGRQPQTPSDGKAQNNDTSQRLSGVGGLKQQPEQVTTKKQVNFENEELPERQNGTALDGEAQNNQTLQGSSGVGGSTQQPEQVTTKKPVNFENEELPGRQPTPRQEQNSNFIHVFLKYYRMAIKEYP